MYMHRHTLRYTCTNAWAQGHSVRQADIRTKQALIGHGRYWLDKCDRFARASRFERRDWLYWK